MKTREEWGGQGVDEGERDGSRTHLKTVFVMEVAVQKNDLEIPPLCNTMIHLQKKKCLDSQSNIGYPYVICIYEYVCGMR